MKQAMCELIRYNVSDWNVLSCLLSPPRSIELGLGMGTDLGQEFEAWYGVLPGTAQFSWEQNVDIRSKRVVGLEMFFSRYLTLVWQTYHIVC